MGGFEFISTVLFTIGMSTANPCTRGMLCPSDWEPWSDSCYKPTTQPLNWSDAGSECKEMGAEMAAPSSREELDHMLSKHADGFWINCNDMEIEGQWECRNGGEYNMELYKRVGDPSGETTENCACVVEDGWWVDLRCFDRYHLAICKGQQVKMKSWRLFASCPMGHTVKEFPTSGVHACAVMCAYHPGCRSFNVLHLGGGEKVCQLNNSSRFGADHAQFKKTENLCIYGEK